MEKIPEQLQNMFPLFQSLIGDNIVAILVALFLIFMLWNGYHRGMLTRVIST